MKSPIPFLIAAMTVIVTTSHAWAAPEPEPLSIKLTVHKIVIVEDREKHLPADAAQPGDLLEYRAEYRNTGRTPTTRLKAVVPVPAQGLEYLPGSASPQAVSASVDGRHFAPAPLTRAVTLPDGRRERRPVPVAEYRYLQWNLGELAPGASAVVKARMKVTGTLAASPRDTQQGGAQ